MSETGQASQPRPDTPPAGQAWVGWVQIGGVALVIVAAAALTGWLASLSSEPTSAPPEQSPAPVRVIQPERMSHTITVEATGTVDVTAFVPLTPQVGGRIVAMSQGARAGATFEAGEVLFRIDPRDYEVAVSRARAGLADARAAARQEEAQATIARTEWDSLYPDTPIMPLAAREPQLEAARARLLSAEADLAQARLNLERTEISLPFAGRVAESGIEAGLLAGAGQALGSAYAFESVEIVAPVPPEALARLAGAEGRAVEIYLEGLDGVMLGRVARVGARLDARTRFIDLFIDPGPAGVDLQPGRFADLLIEGPALDGVMSLPAAAVPGLDTVRLIKDGVIVERRIEVLDRTRDTVIAAVFDPGDGVIISALPEGAVGRAAQIVDGPR